MQLIKKRLNAISDRKLAFELEKLFESLFNTQPLGSANLTGGASATVTTGAAFNAIVAGTLIAKASGASLSALNGPTIQNTGNTWQSWIFTVDALGNFFTLPGVPSSSQATVQLPIVNENATSGVPQCAIGMLTINNASAGAFVPNSTLLNVAGLNPIFNNFLDAFFPIQTL